MLTNEKINKLSSRLGHRRADEQPAMTRIALIYFYDTELPRKWKRMNKHAQHRWILRNLTPENRIAFLKTMQSWSDTFKRSSFEDEAVSFT